ncbi:MAG: Predicted acylesterase/phospholipase RssA, contains patatin domain [Candidatus Kentron sp. G]|nr:MAG: Predicted acylesterase/phospholipase RssA, contains patatin domain [Candidatus Kentron sp. G]VFM99914.1 MAG: Predicted acylesterase/phospholipase RssA, contains patatin domain [Candidatus Kentron sp. G]VFN02742.1 MAG: Predicted acylesterase/phospholipase RssA, contains patatin domain [Candidatus Kentron sp. G]
MKKYGFVASGGGYRSFYTAGALVWLKKQDIPVVHISSTSSGNNIVLDYLIWDWENEALPPVLTKTHRLGMDDIAQVFSNFLGLRPSLFPAGTHLFTVDKDSCRKSLLLDEPKRQALLARHLDAVRWDIAATNLTKREPRHFRINHILSKMDEATLSTFMDAFLAGITTIPYFRALMIEDEYYIEGGYMDNTPIRSLFADPEVDEIIAIDFTDYNYHKELEQLYQSQLFTLPLNSINMHILTSDLELTLSNKKIFSQFAVINELLEAMGKDALEIKGKTYYRKPVHILKPKDLESMTVSLKHSTAQKEYFELGQKEAEALFASLR